MKGTVWEEKKQAPDCWRFWQQWPEALHVWREKGRDRHLLSLILQSRSWAVITADISGGYIAVWQEPLWE